MAQLNAGSGADGNATASSNTNLSTESLVGRGSADAVSFLCTAVGASSATVDGTPTGLAEGDEVVLINIMGIPADYANVGNYEFLTIQGINGSIITFTDNKVYNYGNSGGDTNIGTTYGTNQRVILQRVPQYDNLTVNNSITVTANPWTTGSTFGGCLFMRVKDTLTNNGTITMKGTGYRAVYTNWGGGRSGYSYNSAEGGPSAGHGEPGNYGSGAAHATLGETVNGSAGGTPTYGVATLSGSIFMGCGGGGGEQSQSQGGYGGGILGIFATTINNSGTISADGGDVPTGTVFPNGGGSGGSLLIHVGQMTNNGNTLNALGALGGDCDQNPSYVGGDGGDGRIAVYYNTMVDTLNSTPTAYTDNSLTLPYSIAGTVSESCTINIYDTSSGELISSNSVSAGAYQIETPSSNNYNVVGIPDSGSKNGIIYRNVTPTQ